MCAIRNDGNGDMFAIVYEVAEAETRASWEWFIRFLLMIFMWEVVKVAVGLLSLTDRR
jgi:hypothetical protein